MTTSPDVLVMAKPVGARCNLDCAYCYYLGKEALLSSGAPRSMTDDLLESFIVERMQMPGDGNVHFEWHGGEPTLAGLDFFRRVVAVQRANQVRGRTITNGLQTNGTLLDEAWVSFLAGEGFSVGLSLDGPAGLHDRFRRSKSGQATHARVMRAWRLLQEAGVHTDVLCVVHAGNVGHPLDVYRSFRDMGAHFIQFLPLVERTGSGAQVSSRTAPAADIGAFLCAIFDEWLRRDLEHVVVQTFDEAFRAACGMPHALCVFRETCGDVVVLEHDGSLYPCDHFVEDEHRLGRMPDTALAQLIAAPELKRFGDRKLQALPRSCRECDVLAWCHGGCPKDRFVQADAGAGRVSYLCPAYAKLFRHARPAMERLAAHLRAGKPLCTFAGATPAPMGRRTGTGPNDPCPCGSGRKYKKCCWGRRSVWAAPRGKAHQAEDEPCEQDSPGIVCARGRDGASA